MDQRIGRCATVAAMTTAVAVALSACGNGESRPTVTVTVTPSATVVAPTGTSVEPTTPRTSEPAPPTSAGVTPATAGNGQCVDPASPAVTSALSGLGLSMGQWKYRVAKVSPEAVGACPNLLWVLASIEGATASSPYRLLFFDARGYLAQASDRDTVYTSVLAHGRDTVDAQFRWLSKTDPSYCPQGGPVVVRYTLRGGAVRADRAVPKEALTDG